jgi:PPM family protein phosphatase
MFWTGTPHRGPSNLYAPSATGRLQSAGSSKQGADRRHNEDCIRVDDSLGLILIADGMGGHPGGQVASQLAADAIVDYLSDPPTGIGNWPYGFDSSLSNDGNRLRTAIHAAHIRLLESAFATAHLTGMGTTVATAIERDGHLTVAWVGDSRLYHLSAARLRQVTRDDSWIETALAERPDADLETLRLHPLRNALTNVLGANSRLDVHVLDIVLDEDDVVALTTDGVHGALNERDLRHLLSRRVDPARAAAGLVSAALAAGSADDCSAVVGRYF